MAEKGVLLCFICALCFSSAISRSLLDGSKTTVLDVSASIQKTLDVLSFDPESETLQELKQSSSSSSSFTLQLQSRDVIHKSTHKDYKSLFLARLERDSARVKSLNAKLDLSVRGIKKSDLKPVETEGYEAKVEDLASPIVSGISQGSGEYFSRVGIGRPAKSQYLVIDTGSDVSWVQCAPCSDCYDQADPIYEPSSSSSYASLTCDTQQCRSLDVSACRNGSCLYQVSYGDGSFTVGDFVSESLSLGNSGSVNNIALGCGHDNEGLFVGAAGLLGLGGGSLSFPSQIKASSLSYCLVDRDSSSSSTLDFNSPDPADAVTAPLLRNRQVDTFYYVGLSGLSVGGQMLSIPPSSFEMDESGNGGVIVDSGTAVTRLQTDVYNSLRDAFVKGTSGLPSASGVALFDTCYDLSSKKSVDVPTVAFHFPGGKSLSLPAKNYLVPVDSSGIFCFAFAPTSSAMSILGNIQQQGTRVGFNLPNSVVAFSPNKC
ncbi:protein ASPARTIC PROTEASE IN GUARD CELL 1-like [Telopea speciosissima]|uniref:protein ASPARTIC PROTEASE IN GUARD CELL 1-like n=1 Tax=Telopea speciosissima TaxID=54955 RepID=UPI001CC39039|nr:protein ASPARTIC PROTEASE IN GUARD CELL 1-like [Telopea speciosissima]